VDLRAQQGAAFFDAALKQGVTLLEPMGGLCTGLEACLLNGIRVNKYLYADPDHNGRKLAHRRLEALSAAYPTLLNPEAWADAFELIPHHLPDITASDLRRAGVGSGEQWMLIAYWEFGNSDAVREAQKLVNLLTELCGPNAPGLLLGYKTEPSRSVTERPSLPFEGSDMGSSVIADAARFGSYMHQLYRTWSTLANGQQLTELFNYVRRPLDMDIRQVLLQHHEVPVTNREVKHPYYPCNTVGKPVRVLLGGAVNDHDPSERRCAHPCTTP